MEKFHLLLADCVNPESEKITSKTKDGEKIDAYNLIRTNMLIAGGFFNDELTKQHYELYKKKSRQMFEKAYGII